MRVIAGLIIAIALLSPSATPAAPDPAAAVRTLFHRYDEGWRTFNADEIVALFAPDFEWTNSVGASFTDKTRLRAFLIHLFKQPGFRAGQSGPLVIHAIRIFGDVAVVSSSEATLGKKDSATGKVVPTLNTDELTVLHRVGGRWLIVSDLSADEANGV